MKKLLFIFLFLMGCIPSVSAWQILVENIFSDIGPAYEYRDQLQLLYDRGMIVPDSSGKFSPDSYLNRDEFVGISMEVICERCIQPHTETSFIEEYRAKDVYFDIDTTNPYFYCVAEADARNYVRGYDIGESCQNGVSQFWERPFCPLNQIKLEEAIAVLLRNSGIFTIEDNRQVVEKIQVWNISENISNDVSPADEFWVPYTFYGYLEKALNFEITEYDINGNETILKLLEVDDSGNINPKKPITKEEFLRMAYIVLKSNSCVSVVDNNLAVSIDIWDKSCQEWEVNCEVSSLDDPEDIYDFSPDVEWFCEGGIDDPSGYTWRFYNTTNGDSFFHYGTFLDNILLPSEWEWRVYLTVRDTCGNTWRVYSTIIVERVLEPQIALNVDILAQPIIWNKDLLVKFEWVVYGGIAPYQYSWDFSDTSTGIGKYIDHLFKKVDVFEVKLVVVDSIGLTGSATVLIKVLAGNCSQDSDGDGGNDCEDLCPLVSWPESNRWCPVFEQSCSQTCACDPWYICSDTNPQTCWAGVCVPIEIQQSCLYSPTFGAIFWNTTCNSCPCLSSVDFLADVRNCDLVFPAITSPDAKEIYSRWKTWQIQK